jgi:predicted nucleic acid-binding protein
VIATYLDSSALVRLCVGEGDLSSVEEAMAGLPITSVLASVEVPIAIEARFHRGQIGADDRDELLEAADEILTSVGKIGLSSMARREAVAVARGRLLRALDAIHVGTAVVVNRQQQRRGNALRFCTGDLRQGEAAAACFGGDKVIVLPPL